MRMIIKRKSHTSHRIAIAKQELIPRTYQTTIRSIIPLPDPSTPSHQSSHPSQVENIPKGSIVLALYPDTTAFYQATVVAAPIPGTGMGTSGSRRADPGAKRGKYVLAFVDDGDNTHEVDAKDVVPVS
jgi:SAGA-associated factor 29